MSSSRVCAATENNLKLKRLKCKFFCFLSKVSRVSRKDVYIDLAIEPNA